MSRLPAGVDPIARSQGERNADSMSVPLCPACNAASWRKLDGPFTHRGITYYQCNECSHQWEMTPTAPSGFWLYEKSDQRLEPMPIDFLNRRFEKASVL